MGDDGTDKGGRAWKISKYVNGRLTYMHVKQAIKILLPREYISRSRQKRHWASKYLPGKEPLNPNHDIFKYCDVALKVVQKGKKKFQIGRVEAIQSTKDGSEITSFQTKSKVPVRIRCSLYNHEGDGVYRVRDDVILTNWKPNSSIIGKIVLQPIPGQRFKYTLHPSSKDYLDKLGTVPAYCCEKGSSPSLIEDDNHSDNSSSELDDEFFEVEDVLDRRLSKDTLCYEYKVRFKGYGSEEDMWLPSSFFNRPIQFQSTSKFGRKRKHNLDPENAVEVKKKKSFDKSEPKERNSKVKSSCQVENKAKFRNERKKEQQSSSSAKKSRKPSPNEIKEALEERSTSFDASRRQTQYMKLRPKKKQERGKAFRSSLHLTPNIKKSEDITMAKGNKLVIASKHASTNLMKETQSLDGTREATFVKKRKGSAVSKFGILEAKENKTKKADEEVAAVQQPIVVEDETSEDLAMDIGVLADVRRRNDRFLYPRRILGESMFPEVDDALVNYEVCKSTNALNCDPLTVDKLPPLSVLQHLDGEMRNSKNTGSFAKFPFYGNFGSEGIRILLRFHQLKSLRRETAFEKTWLKTVLANTKYEKEITHALLDRWNVDDTYLTSYQNYRITSQEFSLLCGERYLSDEIVNLLIQKYCDEKNQSKKACHSILLPSFLSSGCVLRNVVESISLRCDIERVDTMFLPVHMADECHWGLAIFSVKEQTIFFDDGYHCPIPDNLRSNAIEIISIMYQTTRNERFQPAKWDKFEKFKIAMPDQPHSNASATTGHGSCGVAVICAARDICAGNTNFTWTYQDTPRLRAELMAELLNLS